MSPDDVEGLIKDSIRNAYSEGMQSGMQLAKDTIQRVRDALVENGLSGEQLDAVNGLVDGFSAVVDNWTAPR